MILVAARLDKPASNVDPRRFRVVPTSLLGYGGTQERRTLADCSIDREVETLEAVIGKAGVPVHLVGHSYGGLACLTVAMRGELRSQVLLSSSRLHFLLEQGGEVELHQQFMTTRERYLHAFETGERRRPVGSSTSSSATTFELAPRMRDHIVATAPTHGGRSADATPRLEVERSRSFELSPDGDFDSVTAELNPAAGVP